MSAVDTKLKIVQIITNMEHMGGAQIHVRDISNYLQTEGHSIHVVTGAGGNAHQLLETISIHRVHHLIRDLRPIDDVKAFLEVRKLLKILKPDLVATHSSKAGIVGRMAAKSLHIPVVFTAHGWSFTDGVSSSKKVFYRFVERIAGQFTSGIIAVSEYDRQLAIQQKVLPDWKIICIQNGVPELVEHKKASASTKNLNLVMVARFAHPKKQIDLLQSLCHLQHLDWTMHFVGDGPEMEKAKRFAKESGIADRVRFEGRLEDVTKILDIADIFLLISQYEGLPLSVLEAMRAGLPIIATNVGGVQEAVTTKNGILVPAGDLIELQKAIEKLIEHPELRIEMGKWGSEIFKERFTFQKMMNETVDYYKSIVGREDR
ncbi:glycosyltransferase family 4 protein [Sporosarcina contaminans]|uniref:Glycosyltransferase family 4 protein n=1 Tax=Sporosarcina contaminans TaxID=633403 RepID=A0ABW3TXT5_9BACL